MSCLACILQGSEEAMYVYMATPLGPALAQITEQQLLKGRAVRNAFPVLAAYKATQQWRLHTCLHSALAPERQGLFSRMS